MCKEAPVKAVHLAIVGRANQHTGSGRPENVDNVIVLPVILLYRIEYASAAKGVTVSVNKAARRTRILKIVAVCLGKQLGLARSHVGISVHIFDERGEPVVRYFHIRIEKHIVFGLNLRQGSVISFGKAIVFIKLNELYRGEMLTQQLHGSIVRSIVGHPYFGLVTRISHHSGQETAQHSLAVPVQNHYRYFHKLLSFSGFYQISSAFSALLSKLNPPRRTRISRLSYSVRASCGGSSTRM